MTWGQIVAVRVPGAARNLDCSQVSRQPEVPATSAVFDQENPLAALLAYPLTRAYLVEQAIGCFTSLPEPAEAILASVVTSKTHPANAFVSVRGTLPPGAL